MPPICWHMVTAAKAEKLLKEPFLRRNLGSFLLGASAPDVRVITGSPREETHFFHLDKREQESGLVRLFQSYPELKELDSLHGSTISFVAGYLTHLIVDEMWINEIYRPFFGAEAEQTNARDANIMDRVIQFEMDRRERSNRDIMESIKHDLLVADLEADMGLLPKDTVYRWRMAVVDIVDQEPNWDMFRRLARRYFGISADLESPEVQEFMRSVPDFVERGLQLVSRERVEDFRRQAVEASALVASDYIKKSKR